MVVPTGALVCGRADGLHRSIERFRLESLNRRIRDDPPYQACSVQSAPTQIGVETQTSPRVQCLGFVGVIILQGLDVESVGAESLNALEASFSGGDCGHDRDSMF